MTKERDLSSPALDEAETEQHEAEQIEAAQSTTRILSASDILDYDDVVIEQVSVPEWGAGAVVLIKAMSGFDRDKFEESITGKEGGTNLSNIRAKMLALSLVDEKGKLLFTADQVNKLGKKSAKPLDRCFTIARQLSGFSKEDVEELAKN